MSKLHTYKLLSLLLSVAFSIIAFPVLGLAQSNYDVVEIWQYGRSEVSELAVSADGTQVALGYSSDNQIEVIDAQTGELQRNLPVPNLIEITDLEWSRSGEQLVVGGGERMFIWNFTKDATPTSIEVENIQSPEFSWSPSDQLATASRYYGQEQLIILDALTFQRREAREVRGLYFPRWSPDGRYIALYYFNLLGDENRIESAFIDVWDTQDRTSITIEFPQIPNAVVSPNEQNVIWLPDSSGLMGFSNDGALWRWSVGTTVAEFVRPALDEDMNNQLFPISINAQGDLLAVSNPETEYHVEIWDVETGESLLRLPGSESVLFEWGADDMLYVYDTVLYAYRITRAE